MKFPCLTASSILEIYSTQAIANAVSNAIGAAITELPITPERVLELIKEKGITVKP